MIDCPICNKKLNAWYFGVHLRKKHSIKVEDFKYQSKENFELVNRIHKMCLAKSRENSPKCIEFYIKRFPELSLAEHKEMLKAHQTSIRNKLKNKKRNRSGISSKEKEIKKMVIEKGMTESEAKQKYYDKRVYASPRRVEYWLSKGFTEEESKQKVSEYQKNCSKRSIEYWLRLGFSEEESKQKVNEYQRDAVANSKSTFLYYKKHNIKLSYEENKKRYINAIKYNQLYKNLDLYEDGFFQFDDDFFEDVLKNSENINNFLNMFLEKKTKRDLKKILYNELVNFFTEKNCRLVENIEKRSFEFHLDHIFSIEDGFKNNISPEIIGSPINLRIITREENLKKGKKSDITIEELLKKYEQYKGDVNGN